jgi:chromosome segregation ATPase
MNTTTDTTTKPAAARAADARTSAAAATSAAALRAELAALQARIADKERRGTDVAGELAAARAERDRLHRDDATPSELAVHRTKLRDLEDEAEGLAGAVDLLKRDVAPLEQRIAKAVQREAADDLEAAVARGNAAFAKYDTVVRAAAARETSELLATLEEVRATIRASIAASASTRSMYSDPYESRVLRAHGALMHIAQTLDAYRAGQQLPFTGWRPPVASPPPTTDTPLALR